MRQDRPVIEKQFDPTVRVESVGTSELWALGVLGFRVGGFRVLRFRVGGFRVEGFRVQGLGLRV